jgi:hypothetical protein
MTMDRSRVPIPTIARRVRAGAVVLALAAAGCAGAGAPAGTPVADPEGAARELSRATTPASPQQFSFEWTLDEAGSRLRGRGVARVEAPDRIRLDLFGPRGETYLSAALVGDEFRLPQGMAGAVPLPSPALLWGALGVVRPPADARVVEATTADAALTVRFAAPNGETFTYRAAGEPLRLETLARAGRAGTRESLQLTHDERGVIRTTRYRELDAFRELILTVESVTDVASFPAEIWSPGAPAF